MSWLAPDEGEIIMADAILADAGTAAWQIDLFTNDITPDSATVFADLTLLADPKDVSASHWPGSATNGAGKAESVNNQTYSWGGTGGYSPATCYGWVIYKGTTILMVERFAGGAQSIDDTVAADVASIKFRLFN